MEEKFNPDAANLHRPGAVGIKIRQSLADFAPMHGLGRVFGVLFFLVPLIFNIGILYSFSTTTFVIVSVALALLLGALAPTYFIDIVWLVVRPDCIYFRRIHNIFSEKRRVSKEEIAQILHVKNHIDEADPTNTVVLQLSSGKRVPLYEAGRNPLNAEWLVDMLHDTLGAPVGEDVQRSLSLRFSEAEDKLHKQISGSTLTAVLSGETSIRTEEPVGTAKAALAEVPYSFAVVRPNSKAYARFLKKLPSELGERARTESAFVVMQDCRSFVLAIVICFCFILALSMLLFPSQQMRSRPGQHTGAADLVQEGRDYPVSDLVLLLAGVAFIGGLPFTLFHRRWYSFFPDELVVCERVLAFRIKWQIDRNDIHSVISEVDAKAKNLWQVNMILTNGATVLFPKIDKAKSAKWLADVIRTWMGDNTSTERSWSPPKAGE